VQTEHGARMLQGFQTHRATNVSPTNTMPKTRVRVAWVAKKVRRAAAWSHDVDLDREPDFGETSGEPVRVSPKNQVLRPSIVIATR